MSTSLKKLKFDLELKEGRFLLRLAGMSLVGMIITMILRLAVPGIGTYLVLFLTVLLIYIALVLLLPVLARLRALAGVLLAWEVGILISVVVYFLIPMIVRDSEGAVMDATRLGVDYATQHDAYPFLVMLSLAVLLVALIYEQYLKGARLLEYSQETAEIKDLDMRIRPHFLFNSLNSVTALIHTQPDEAEEGLMDLADMFRIIMTDKRRVVPITAELEMAKKYVSLEKMRLGNRFTMMWDLRGIDTNAELPILTLQPLIENAIYHGIETRLNGGTIAFKSRLSEEFMFISIVNPLPEGAHIVRKGNQIAQRNLRDRIALTYGARGSISIVQTQQFYTVSLKIPRIR